MPVIVTYLINIMGLILPGLSSAYVGERGKAHSEQVLELAQQAEKVNPTFLHLFFLPTDIKEATKDSNEDGNLWDKSDASHSVWANKWSVGIYFSKHVAKSNLWHQFKSYPCKQ